MKVSSATRRALCWLLSLALSCGLAETAGAQAASQGAAGSATDAGPQPTGATESRNESAGGLQQIVVTARKVTERLQDVPMSVTALNSESLEQSGAINL
jgi:iron complex outermembrane recepter protein